MLYTTYFNKINELPKDMVKLIITRFLPKEFKTDKYRNTHHIDALAPNQKILFDYKKDNNWDNYVKEFKNQMASDEKMQRRLDSLEKRLLEGRDYALICYEKDYKKCHRYLIAKYFEKKGIEWKEL